MVGLVEHGDLDRGEVEAALLEQVLHAARGADHDVDALRQRADLAGLRHAADDLRRVEADGAGDRLHGAIDLQRELAGRREDQRARARGPSGGRCRCGPTPPSCAAAARRAPRRTRWSCRNPCGRGPARCVPAARRGWWPPGSGTAWSAPRSARAFVICSPRPRSAKRRAGHVLRRSRHRLEAREHDVLGRRPRRGRRSSRPWLRLVGRAAVVPRRLRSPYGRAVLGAGPLGAARRTPERLPCADGRSRALPRRRRRSVRLVSGARRNGPVVALRARVAARSGRPAAGDRSSRDARSLRCGRASREERSSRCGRSLRSGRSVRSRPAAAAARRSSRCGRSGRARSGRRCGRSAARSSPLRTVRPLGRSAADAVAPVERSARGGSDRSSRCGRWKRSVALAGGRRGRSRGPRGRAGGRRARPGAVARASRCGRRGRSAETAVALAAALARRSCGGPGTSRCRGLRARRRRARAVGAETGVAPARDAGAP